MSDPIQSPIINVQAKEDFLIQQAELRQARARWVDEHERPIPMVVMDDKGNVAYPATFKDKDGNERATPFMLGCHTYSAELPHEADPDSATGYRRPAITFLPDAASEDQKRVAAQVGEVTRQYNQFSGTMVPDRGGEIALSHKSDHPPIHEGETHEEWFNRVRKAYSDAPQGDAGTGTAATDPDSVRRSAGDDPGDGRPALALGAEGGGDHPPADLHREPVADGAGGPIGDADIAAAFERGDRRAAYPGRRPGFAARCLSAAARRVRAMCGKRHSGERESVSHLQRERKSEVSDEKPRL